MKRLLVLAAVVSAAVAALAAGPAHAIIDGKPEPTRYPHVVMVLGAGGLCTGTVIHPSYVLTAAHCTHPSDPGALVVFESDARYVFYMQYLGMPGWVPPVPIPGMPLAAPGEFIWHPGFCPGCGPGVAGIDTRDVALVRLPFDARAVLGPAFPSLVNDVRTLPKRAVLTTVGYGLTARPRTVAPPPPPPNVEITQYGRRMSAQQTVNPGDGPDAEYLRLSAAKGGSCAGDSGGPAFQGDTIVAITAFVTNPNCAGNIYFQRIDIPPVRSFIDDVLAGRYPPPPTPTP